MKTIVIKKANPIADRAVPNVTILLIGELQDCDTLEDAANVYEAEAQKLFDVLRGCLPGGVFDRLTAKMLQAKASLLAIPHVEDYTQQEPACPGCVAGKGIGTDHLESCDEYVPF